MNTQATSSKARDQDKPGRKSAKTAKKQARASGRAARRQAKFALRAAKQPAVARKTAAKKAAPFRSPGDAVPRVPSEPAVERPAKLAARSAAKSSAKSAAKRSKAFTKRPAKLAPRVASTRVSAASEAAAAAGAPVRSQPSALPGPNETNSLEVAERQLTMLVRTSALLGQESSRSLPLDRSSYLLLYILEKHGPCTVSTLATEVCLAASTVTRQVAAMCAAGLVASEPAAGDRRARVVTMQAHGRELFSAERGRRRRLLRAITGSWSEDEWNEFAELLARLNASLGELFDGAPLAYQR